MGLDVHIYVKPNFTDLDEVLESTGVHWVGQMRPLYERMRVLQYFEPENLSFLFDPRTGPELTQMDHIIDTIRLVEHALQENVETQRAPIDLEEERRRYSHCQEWGKLFVDLRLLRGVGVNCKIFGIANSIRR
jgi:hypothetical protein